MNTRNRILYILHYALGYGAVVFFILYRLNLNKDLLNTILLGYLVYIASDEFIHWSFKKY